MTGTDLPVRVRRYGRDEPLPERRQLRAGPLSAILEGGDLRYVAIAGREVMRRLYVAVRDRNWGTIPPRYEDFVVREDDAGFEVRFAALHDDGDVGFRWDGRIAGTRDGVVTAEMDGVATRTFLRNRIGWCILHPMDLAGSPVRVEHPDGTREAGTFPAAISPHQPFFDIVAIAHPVSGSPEAEVTLRFAGDVFEMEDQRNWTDASYKTYSTPLRLPYPVEIRAGDRVAQSVTLTFPPGEAPAASLGRSATADLRIEVGAEPIGPLPPIGLGVASHGAPLAAAEVEALRALRPAHLRVALDLAGDGWQAGLRQAAAEAAALGAALELEVVAGDAGEGLEGLVPALGGLGVPIARLLVFPVTGWVTTAAVVDRARRLAEAAGLRAPIGGGSRADFTELNRAADLPRDRLDVVGYTLNPQVHAFDEASVVETLAAQAVTVESARAIAGGRPLAVGPVTLRPRVNPAATGPAPEPGPEELPPPVDPRQLSLFGAGWTVGALHRLATAGAGSITLYETTGWRGVMEAADAPSRPPAFPSRPGTPFPLFHVLADLAPFAGSDLLPISLDDPLAVEALALRAGDRLRILIASFLDGPRRVSLSLPQLAEGRLRLLDETTYAQATQDGEAFRRRADGEIPTGADRVELELRPFAVATIDGRSAEGAR